MKPYDVIIIGAGAAGLMCAWQAGARGRQVLLLEHNEKPGEKIRISGGGRCNFTNIHTTPKNFLSQNPHFCVSALRRFTPGDFIELIESENIKWHEKTLGQLFCDESAQQIIDLFIEKCRQVDVQIKTSTEVHSVRRVDDTFEVETNDETYHTSALVIATGGKSIPKMGASGFGYDIAKQFGLSIIEPRPALVPLTWDDKTKESFSDLSGVSTNVVVRSDKTSFEEALLFTHRGLSGPAILQISSYWREGDEIEIDLLPNQRFEESAKEAREAQPRQTLSTLLGQSLPKRLLPLLCPRELLDKRLADLSNKLINEISLTLHHWKVKPVGSEGYRTAEVTLGGVDTNELSSKTMECKMVSGLYFIGEVVDVTGHLGGFNFQWAWSSGHAAGQVV